VSLNEILLRSLEVEEILELLALRDMSLWMLMVTFLAMAAILSGLAFTLVGDLEGWS